MAQLEELLGKQVLAKDGSSVAVTSLVDNDLLGIYFSAHWCSPCRGSTLELAESYNKLKAAGKKFEIVFMSLDKDEESCKQYYDCMPWLLFPFESDLKDKNENKSETLSVLYNVTEIPTLLLLDPKSNVLVSNNGLDLIEKDPDGTKFPWK